MSSQTYSTSLTPEPQLRRVVLVSGASLAVVGVIAIATLPLEAWQRALLGIGWLIHGGGELVRLRAVYRRLTAYRLTADGGIEVFSDSGRPLCGRILSGTVVLSRVAWLRVRLDDGCRSSELVRGNSRESQQWRRFQVIFRHLGAC